MLYLAIIVLLQVATTQQNGDIRTFRQLYERVPQKKLSALPRAQFLDTDSAECAEKCVKEQQYLCKSFDLDNDRKMCLLYAEDHEDRDVYLFPTPDVDHYQSAYARLLFDKTPGHRLHTWMNSQQEECSVEQCARMCVLEARFKCQSFNYDPRSKICRLTEYSEGEGYGIILDPTIDFYRRKPEGNLVHFINFGQAALSPLTERDIYQKTLRGNTLDECATLCVDEPTFHCASFDYTHEGEMSLCHMSRYIAANVRGLRTVPNSRINHYERIEDELSYFYPIPYSVLLGNDQKTYTLVTPNRCARMCMQEQGFVCRSFDYQVTEGKCTLSDKTGSDVGGLYYGAMTEVHHFEMKPILDCGGNLTGPRGDFASPGWPRNYSHHEQCSWNISVPNNKVISITFTHLDIGVAADEACDTGHDRLVVIEKDTESCIRPNTQIHATKGNQAILKFYSNSEIDAQGFRAFYTAEWTCDARLTESPGDFASPQWPNNYPLSMLCSWRISAPTGYRIRLYFTSFQLERNALGHCNEDVDHVKVLDGGSVKAQRIGLYCGSRASFDIKSSGNDLFVQFFSDVDRSQEGFHATFVFELTDEIAAGHIPPVPPDHDVVDLDKTEDSVETNSDESVEDKSIMSKSNEDGNSVVSGGKGYHGSGPETAADQHYARLSSEYKSVVWGVITLLLVLLIAVTVILFLVWRHYKHKVRHLTHLLQEEPLLSHEQPITVTYQVKPNNVTLGNEVDLSHLGACGGGANDSYTKYRNENIKNVNLDTKYDSEAMDKCNLNSESFSRL